MAANCVPLKQEEEELQEEANHSYMEQCDYQYSSDEWVPSDEEECSELEDHVSVA